jgi:hypothetical protein
MKPWIPRSRGSFALPWNHAEDTKTSLAYQVGSDMAESLWQGKKL